jgi:hypothetical protein
MHIIYYNSFQYDIFVHVYKDILIILSNHPSYAFYVVLLMLLVLVLVVVVYLV